MKRNWLQAGLLIVLVSLLVFAWSNQQAVQDWWQLRSYTAPSPVATLATDDTMTTKATHLFYLNHPDITADKTFTNHCPAGSEKTIVLGCYLSPDNGIYVYAVTDPRLNGVEQVTAAHEMLHAAYRRLSTSERNKVDAMLLDYYNHGLTDQRIKDTIAAYKQSEPTDVVNEMHSVFGTEITSLPSPLEAYYMQYFTNRAAVTAYAAQYQAEFTNRDNQLKSYEVQLSSLKPQIEQDESAITQDESAIATLQSKMNRERSSGQISAYNADVPAYNQLADQYNALLSTTKGLINQYNDIVAKHNAIALEEQQLTNELSASSLGSK